MDERAEWLRDAVRPYAEPDLTATLTTRSGATLQRYGDVVAKLHRAGTDPVALNRRLVLCERSALLSPLAGTALTAPDGRLVTLWPRVIPASATDDELPWAEAAELLASLHSGPAPTDLPHGWIPRLERAVDRLDGELKELGSRLLGEAKDRGQPTSLIHGDWHLGQLGRRPGSTTWRLIDIDDLGVGDPAWDLARPAGFWAAGLLDDKSWQTFLDGYRRANPSSALADDVPWLSLDLPARCAILVAASSAGVHSPDTAEALLTACRRMAELDP